VADRQTTDAGLLDAAEKSSAADGVPTTLAGLRRRRLRHYDVLSTTWDAWDIATGRAVWLKVLRPRWREMPSMVRRFEHTTPADEVRSFAPCVSSPVPHRVLQVPGTPLSAVQPVSGELAVSLPERTAALAHGLAGLHALHSRGRSLGLDLADWLTLGPHGPRLVDADQFDAVASPEDDLRSLALAVHLLAPQAVDPIATLARTWVERPPPTADDGAVLLRRAMAAHLAWLRHQLARSRRIDHKARRVGQLSRLLTRLADVQCPPEGSACLSVSEDGVYVMVHSDGRTLVGGPVPSPVHAELPLVWSQDGGIDPVAARLLMRAWSQRRRGRSNRMAEVQQALGEAAVDSELFARWLSAARRLRSARLLLDAEARFSVVR